MKNSLLIGILLLYGTIAYAQTPAYNLILKNDTLVNPTVYEFDLFLERSGVTALELASLEPVMVFNPGITTGSLTFTIISLSSELNVSQQPTAGDLSIAGNELRIASRIPPGAGNGTIVPATPGLRVGRFRLASDVPFANESASIAWKNGGAVPMTNVSAYVGGINTVITDTTSHLNQLSDPNLSPLTITSLSPLPSATAGISYAETLKATGGTLPYAWSLVSGSLPSGFTLSGQGIINGTSTSAGTSTFVVQLVDGSAASTSRSFTLNVVPGVPTHLSFVQQPSNAVAGATLSPPVTVQLKDAFENDARADTSISIALSSGSGTLSGTAVRRTSANGLATFDNLSINLAGIKILAATCPGLASAASNAFTISPGPPRTLMFIQEPTDAVSNTTITPPITVQVQDSLGNYVLTPGISVSLSIATGTGVLSGTATRTTDSFGIATFGGLSINLAGTKTLNAGGTGLISVGSSPFTITAGPVSNVDFLQQPTNTTAGGTITPSVSVQLRDAAGNSVAASGIQIQVSLLGSGTLSGTRSRSTNGAGVASFNNLSIDSAGTKRLRASSSGLSPDTSIQFTISPAAPTRLAFIQQPSNGFAGAAIAPPVTVQLRDSFGNNVPHAGDSIFISLSSGSGSLSGTTLQTTNASGVATFGDLVINQGGAKTLTASGPGLTSVASASFALSTLTITASAGANGAISPSGNISVLWGANQSFLITANTGYHVDSLIVDGTDQGPLRSYLFAAVTANHTIRAVFVPDTILVTVQTVPTGMQINIDNILYTSPRVFSWTAAESHSITVVDTVPGGSGRRLVWSSWSDLGAKAHTVTPLVDSTYTANFTSQFFLTMSANTGGSVSPASGWRDSGSVVTITAIPDARYVFSRWSGLGNGATNSSVNPATITMNEPITETANFVRAPIQITIDASPPGRAFVFDTQLFTTQQTFTVPSGSTHALGVWDPVQNDGTPGKQFLWNRWSDGGEINHLVIPENDTTFTAFFGTQFYLTMAAISGGSASPSSNWYDSGSVVGITAIPLSGYTFSGWRGTGNGSYTGLSNPSSVTMRGPVRDTATFTQFPIDVTVQSIPTGRTIIVDGVQATAPQSYIWTSLSNHSIATIDSQVSGNVRYLYRNWSDGGAMSHNVSSPGDTSFTVSFSRQYFLTMGADSGGTVTPSSGWRDSGSVAGINAIPNSGFIFGSWTGTGVGSYSGITNPASVLMNAPITELAHFNRFSARVTIQTVPPGLTIIVDTVAYTAPQTFAWTTGTTHSISTVNNQTASAGTRQVWSSWSDGGAITHNLTVMNDTSVTANFTTQYYLTMSANPGGTVSPASNWFNAGQIVSISAEPDSAHYFALWTGVGPYAYNGNSNPASIIMYGPATQTANFIRRPVTIVIRSNPVGRPFLYDGVVYTEQQTRIVMPGEQHSLFAASPQTGSPGVQYVFRDWSDGGAQYHTIFPDDNLTYTVNFTTQYYLTIGADDGGTAAPASGWRDSGSVVTISATPNLAYAFTAWRGTGNGSYTGPDNPATVRMNSPISDTAGFTQFPVHVTIQSNPPGRTFIVDGIVDSTSQTYVWISGSSHSVSLSDTQRSGTGTRYLWENWSDGGAKSHVIAPTQDTTITVNFLTEHFLTMNAGNGGTVTPPSGWHAAGEVVSISAQPAPTYYFGGWNGAGSISYTGANNPSSVTMNGPITETASFYNIPVSVSLRTQPYGLSYLVDGVKYDKPEVFTWNIGSAHTISVPTPQSAGEGVQYAWRSWSDGGAITHTIQPNTDSTFTAGFGTQFMFTNRTDSGGTVLPPSGWQDSGKSLQITAIPDPGFHFSGWNGTGAGEYTGTSNPVTININGPIIQTASFTRYDAQVTLSTVPSGRTIVIDDSEYTSPQSFIWLTGSTHTIAIADTHQLGTIDTRYVWKSWSDGQPKSHTITILSDSTITANFSTQYFLTMNANPGGTVDPPSNWYTAGDVVTITGIPEPTFTFARWTGTGNGSFDGFGNPATVTMNGPITELANFRYLPIHISISTIPQGRLFTFDGITFPTPQTFTYDRGTQHYLDAPTPQPGRTGMRYIWSSWSDSGARSHPVLPVSDTSFIAYFDSQYTLTVSVSPALAGNTVPSGTTYATSGDTVSLEATPMPGFAFANWSGDISSSLNPVSVIMDTQKSVTANFSAGSSVTITTNPVGRSVTVDGKEYSAPVTFSWIKGSTHSVSTVTLQPGGSGTQYLWNSWSDGGAPAHTVSVPRDSTFVANFTTQHYLTMNSSVGGSVVPASGWVTQYQAVKIQGIPAGSYRFVEWQGTGNGSYSGMNDTATIIMNGPITEIASFGVIIPPPLLTGIPDNSTGISTSPTLTWFKYQGATSYRLQVSSDPLFGNALLDTAGIADTSYTVSSLANLIKYYWRVNARVPANITPFSIARSFTTLPATITVKTPSLNWGTGYFYDISWSSADLSGPVTIRLLLNNGAIARFIKDSLPGSGVYTWRIPDSVFYISPTCRLRVESHLNPLVYGESNSFSIDAGALPFSISMSPLIPYPAEPYASSDYRLFSIPGILDTLTISFFVSGTQVKDWRLFADNGSDENYLEEMSARTFLATGTGYWFVHKGNLQISEYPMTVPPLRADATFPIRIRHGWNIIANPFNSTVPWQSVVEVNGLPATTTISGYNGAYESSAFLDPFKGYYYFNAGDPVDLKFQYPFGTNLPQATTMPSRSIEGGWRLQLAFSSGHSRDEENFIGIAPDAREGLDARDARKPPFFLDQGYLYFSRPAWDPQYPRFSEDIRPSIGEGQEWRFEVSNPQKTRSHIEIRGLEDIPQNYKVMLINDYNTIPIDLRAHPGVTFTPVSNVTPLRILVGTEQFVQREVSKLIPTEFELTQNFPNPFNPATSISVKLPQESPIRLEIYSVLGQRIKVLADGQYGAGTHTFIWEGTDESGTTLSSGVYLYRLTANGKVIQSKKMIFAK